jgi:2-oxoglutarate ferredoxin oxidoreductase subunit alpha
MRSISIALSGSGGAGVMTAGELLLGAAGRDGLFGTMSRSFGPQIRGGEAAALLRLGDGPVEGPGDRFDLLVALDWGNIERFAEELPLGSDSRVVADPDDAGLPERIACSGATFVPVALAATARQVRGGRANLVAVGLVARAAGIGRGAVEATVRSRFEARGDRQLGAALAALAAGWAMETPLLVEALLASAGGGERWNLSGNEAAGLGAIRGGVRFVAAYPITPATDMLEWLADALPASGGTLIQAEDELASINMCLGASFGGAPSLTATSGPGLSLMMESVGLAVASETPVVVVDVMRGGPSTGIPTKSEQTDLNIAVHGLHGEAPHPVLAPLDIADAITTTEWAVRLAEALQTAVLVLSDQALAQSRAIIEAPDQAAVPAARLTADAPESGTYQRHAVTDSGVSPMAVPGTPGGLFVADGLEHDARGRPSASARDHSAQLDKRRDKLLRYDYGSRWADIDDSDSKATVAIVTWGSSTRPAREALDRLRRQGLALRLIAVRLLWPLDPDALADALDGIDRAVVVEHNHSGQFLGLLRSACCTDVELIAHHRPGPLPLRPGDLAEVIRAHAAPCEET